MLKDLIKNNKVQFISLCQSHRIKSLFAFGSSVQGVFTDKSDIDFVVDINERDPLNRGEILISLWDKLEKLFNRKIDLFTTSSLKNPVLKERIAKTQKLVYDGTKEEVLL